MQQLIKTFVTGEPVDVTSEKKAVLMCEPHLIAFMEIMDHRAGDEHCDIAKTDGNTTYYGEKYLAMRMPERSFMFVHQLFHGVFRHVDRALMKRLLTGVMQPAFWNYAGDAIINEAIVSNAAMPSGMFRPPVEFKTVFMKDIHDAVTEAIAFSGQKPPETYDPKARHGQQIEILYDWMMWALEAVRQSREEKNDQLDRDLCPGCAANDDDKDPQKRPETLIERMSQEDAWDLIEDLNRLEEMLDKGESPSRLVDEIENRINEARQRIANIVQSLKLAGVGKGSMIIDMSADLPPPVVPWERVLRRVITSGLGTRMEDSYTRFGSPTRSSLAMGSRHVPFSPGTTIFTDRPKILVILDVSGSNVGNLPQCFSEIWSIARKKGAIVEILTFDDGVQQKILIQSQRDFNKVMKEGIRGNGGTSLHGVFEEASKMRDPYKSMIVMTDGYLSIPKKPKIGVVWLITHDGVTEPFEKAYGEVIQLPKPFERKAA